MFPKVEIVLLSGYRGSGKDTAAQTLIKDYGYNRVSFAGVLKKMCSDTFGIPMDWFEDRELKEKPLAFWPYLSPRDILIKIGTDSLRNNFDKNIWLNLCARKIVEKISETKALLTVPVEEVYRFVITDTRFLNELTLPSIVARELAERNVLPKGTEVWSTHVRIVRVKLTKEEETELWNTGHESDRQYLQMTPDLIIENTGTIDELGKMMYVLSGAPKHLSGTV